MEKSNKRYNLRPLPGGRRGASGAGAGCFSLRDTGGEALSRRAPATQNATAERRGLNRRVNDEEATAESLGDDTISLFPSISSTRPSYRTSQTSTLSTSSTLNDVVQNVNLDAEFAPTLRTPRKRKQWTPEMNEFILRTYLHLTALETDTRNYLEPLHLKFTEAFPDMQVSRQRVGDQRRAIVRNQLLPKSTIEKIHSEVKEELDNLHNRINTDSIRAIIFNETQFTTPQTDTDTSHLIENKLSGIYKSQTQTRMRWTNEHNEILIRLYYRITKLETDRTNYRKSLHSAFITAFPSLSYLTEQRVADQRRAIICNKYLNENNLYKIRRQVSEELQLQVHDINMTNNSDIEQPENRDTEFHISNMQTNPNEEQRDALIDETFQEVLQYFKDIEPTARMYIPKQKTSKKFAKVVSYLNSVIIPENVNIETDFNTLQTVIYCSAWTAAKLNGAKLTLQREVSFIQHNKEYKPNWQKRLERKIEDLRRKIGRLTQYINGNTSRNNEYHVQTILKNYQTHSTHEQLNTLPSHVLDTLKQKLLLTAARLKRYKACTLRKQQNNQFTNNEKLFYRNIRQITTNRHENHDENHTPDPDILQNYWARIWEQPVQHNTEAEWIKSEIDKNIETTQQMEFDSIPIDTFKKVLLKQHNWKSPGSDYIHSYWYKKFTNLHSYLYNYINCFIQDPNTMPSYITHGTTFMIPKDSADLANPAKYRPITCLQTIYKILTSCISELIYKHLNNNNILTEQQKGCRKLSQGCKEQLIIDSVILKQVQKTKTNLFTMYIDYKKAYDSVPHSWLLKVLEIYRVHPIVIKFLQSTMVNWQTKLKLTISTVTLQTNAIKICRGLFQGDALSPLWFCLALNPLSNILNSSLLGFHIPYIDTDRSITEDSISHLLYMDDIKLYASNENNLNQLANLTEKFTADIKMEFGIDKCRINSIKAGQNYQHFYALETGQCVEPLSEQETYKYLGYHQSSQICYKDVKQKLKQQFQHRLNSILKTQLNSRNTVKAINTFAIPVLTYSFGVINWSKSDLKTLQRKINTTMTKFRKHHPRSCVQRLTLSRSEGGRGLIDITNLHNKQIISLRKYFSNKTDSSPQHKAIVYNDRKLTPLNLSDENAQSNETLTDDKTKISEWAGKSLHGRHRSDLCQPNVDKEASNAWLSHGELFPETEGFMMAIQDQVVETKNYQKYIMKTLTSDTCRKCNSCPETIQHITGACKAIAQTDYKHRHNQIANIIHQKLAQQYNLITTSQPYYKYNPDTVLENSTTKLYYDRAILTDRTIHHNRPDITLINKTYKTAYLIDIAVPNTHNLQLTITEKLSKYTELKDEIARLWNLQKVIIIPIVISATGVIPKLLHSSIQTLNLNPDIYKQMQKAAILNTCRLVRKFLQTEPDNNNSVTLNNLTTLHIQPNSHGSNNIQHS